MSIPNDSSALGPGGAYRVEWMSDDSEESVPHTLRRMREYALRDSGDSLVRREAELLTKSDPEATIAAVWNFVKDRVTFTRDAVLAEPLSGLSPDHRAGAEVLIPPSSLLRMPDARGDCDDYHMLAAALLQVCRVPWQFVVVEADAARPGEYSHVYLQAYANGRWIPLDASHAPAPGYEFVSDRPIRRGAYGGGVIGDVACGTEDSDPCPGVMTMNPSAANWWQALITSAAGTAGQIIGTRYGSPAPGTVIQQTPNGNLYVQGGGSPAASGAAALIGSSPISSSAVLIGGAVLLGVVLIVSKNKATR